MGNSMAHYRYKGYEMDKYHDYEPDNVKISYDCRKDGKFVATPFSPYMNVKYDEFVAWVDEGTPSSRELGHNITSIDQIKGTKSTTIKRRLFKLLEKLTK